MSKEFPPKGTENNEPNPWDALGEDAQEDLRDDESLPLEERINRSSKREKAAADDPNADDIVASERSFRMELMSQLRDQQAAKKEAPDINNIGDQLDDSDIPDDPNYDPEYHFRAHEQNGMEENPEAPGKKAPESIDDLRKMGYSQDQIDDWTAEGLDPLEEYKHATPAGGGDDEYHFRAHQENGMEGPDYDKNKNPDTKKKPENVNDLIAMGYSKDQIDDWIADGLDPMDEYMNAVPAGGGDDDYNFRAHEQNGMEQNDDDGSEAGGDDSGEQGDENGEDGKDDFERGETEPNGDFGSWLKDKYGYDPADFDNLPDDEREKILNEYGTEKGIEMGGGASSEGTGEGAGEDGGEGGEKGEDGGEDGGEQSKGEEALAFVSLCTEKEAQLAAHDIAEAMFAEKVAHSRNPFKRIIMGNMLKEGVLAHYRKQALEAIVAYNADKNDSNKKVDNQTVAQYWSKKGGIERFTKAYMEQVMPAIHKRAGENMQGYTTRTDENGEIYVVTKSTNENGDIIETRVDADKNPGAKAAIEIRKAIEAYAGGTSDLASLKEQVRRIQQGEGMTDEKLDLSVDNLVELAEAAKQRAEHAEGIINVMEGFSYINGEAMRSVRSESHKTRIEKASEWVSEHTMGLISPEVIGGAASLMLFFADKGARTAARAVAPGVGGALIAGAAAGIRERGRVAGDIQTSSREAAMGKDVSGPEGNKGKYDRDVAKTLYEMQSAEALTESLETAITNGDTDAMQKALANIEALINISDSQKVDLIRFSSSENIEDERMNMDVARAKAEVALKKAGIDISNSDTYRDAMDAVRSEISRDMDAKDKARCKLKTKRMFAQGAKTAAISIVAGTAIREVSAYFNPNQVGILDHVFNKENNYDATNTPLASFLGLKEPDTVQPGELIYTEVQKYSGQELTKSQIDELGRAGYRIESRDIITGGTTTTQVDVAEYAKNHSGGGFVRNWLNNGSPKSDGNELGGRFDDTHGWYTEMHGQSFGGGVTRDFEDDMAAGKVHAFFSFSRGSQSMPIQLSERVFTAADGSQQMEYFSENPAIQSLLDQKLGMVEIASETGRIAEDGSPIYDIWATWPGKDVTGMIEDTIDTTTKKTVYDVFETITERGPSTVVEGASRLINGIAIFPFASRKALHRAKPLPVAKKKSTDSTPPTPPTPPNPPEPPAPGPGPDGPNPPEQRQPDNPEATVVDAGPGRVAEPPKDDVDSVVVPGRTPNINNIGEQLDDSEVPDDPNWDPEYQFRAHEQNGMEQNDDNPTPTPPVPPAPRPNPNDISEQLDDNEIPDDPNWDPEYQFRAHQQNGMEQNDDQAASAEAADRSRQEEIDRLRQQIASSQQRERDNRFDDGVVASERSYRQGLLARLNELTGGADNRDTGASAEAAERAKQVEIERLRAQVRSSQERERANRFDDGVVASERAYRQGLLARLSELTGDTARAEAADTGAAAEAAAERAKQVEIERLRAQVRSSQERERNNSSDDGVVASERAYRQGLLARLSELTGTDARAEAAVAEAAAERAKQVEIERLRAQVRSSQERERNNSSDDGVVASERAYRQGLLARLSQLTGEAVAETGSGDGAGAEASPDTAPNPVETGFRPDGGGEWTVDNLKDIPNDDAFITSMLNNTLTGQQILAARNGNRIRFNRAMNVIRARINRLNRSSLTPAQKAAAFNGGSVDGLNDQAREDIISLRADGILPESAS